MDDKIGNLMLEQLKLLRGDIGQTNERLDQLRKDMTKGFLETNTKLADLTGEVRELKNRFDHFVQFAGQEVRDLRETVADHERRLARIEEAGDQPNMVREPGPGYEPKPES